MYKAKTLKRLSVFLVFLSMLSILSVMSMMCHINFPAFCALCIGEENAEEAVKIKDGRETVPLPVIMYHDIIENRVRRDIYTITPQAFEEDLKWLKDNGYQTIGISEVTGYVENGAKLPDKPVILTFDDGHYNNIIYAEPILEKYGMKGIIFVIGEFCDKSVKEGVKNPNYSYIFWDDQRRMIESGIWEVENHTYRLHRIGNGRNGVAKLKGESDDDYRARLRDDFQWLTDKIYESCGVRPRAFAYPFGVLSDTAEEVLSELDYKASFTSYSGITELKAGKPESMRLIRRYLRTPKNAVSALLSQ